MASSSFRRPRRLSLSHAFVGWVAALSCSLATGAAAQEAPSLLAFPERARAIVPAGLVKLDTTYEAHPWVDRLPRTSESRPAYHAISSRLETRVPIDQLLLHATVRDEWLVGHSDSGEYVVHGLAGPLLGASYRDAIGSWRYELGAAATIPLGRLDLVHDREHPSRLMPLLPALPLANLQAGFGGGAWNGGHFRRESFWIQTRARVEVDATDELVLAGEIVNELLEPVFQTAIEAAYRIEGLSMIGLRAQLVWWVDRDLVMQLEPNARIGFTGDLAGLIVEFGIPIVLMDIPYIGPLWSVGARLGVGAVF